jgi:hypothetical protein
MLCSHVDDITAIKEKDFLSEHKKNVYYMYVLRNRLLFMNTFIFDL